MRDVCFIGEDVLLSVGLSPMDGVSMSEMDFDITVFTRAKKESVEYKKSECHRIDNNTYSLILPTAKVGVGTIVCVVTAKIPDSRAEDGYRAAICRIDSGIMVVNPY